MKSVPNDGKKFGKQSTNKGESSSKRGGPLAYWTDRDGRSQTNCLEWIDTWTNIKILAYGPEYQTQLMQKELDLRTIEEKVSELSIIPERETARDCWIPTDEEIQLIEAQPEGVLRDIAVNRIYSAWKSARVALNAEIKSKNLINDERRKVIVKKHEEQTLIRGQIIAAVMADMSRDSKLLIQHYVRKEKTGSVDQDEGETDSSGSEYRDFTLNKAAQDGNWLFVFEAAIETHVTRGSIGGDDPTATYLRIEQEIESLKKMHQGSLSFPYWLTQWDYRIDTLKELGRHLKDQEAIHIFISLLNPELFKSIKDLYSSTFLRTSLPKTFTELKFRVSEEFNMLQITNPRLVERTRRFKDDRNEVALLATEAGGSGRSGTGQLAGKGKVGASESKKENSAKKKVDDTSKGKSGCFICGATGEDFHPYRKCKFFDENKTIEECQTIASSKKSVKFAGTVALPKPDKQEKTGICFEVSKEYEDTRTVCESIGPVVRVYFGKGVADDEIDFVYDCGTESGLHSSRDRGLVKDIVNERVTLKGIGGSTTVDELGQGLWGPVRLIDSDEDLNLVGYNQIKDDFQTWTTRSNELVMQGWPGGKQEGVRYVFKQDPERYGDVLLHCTMKRSAVKKTLHALNSFYDPAAPPNHEGIDIDHRSAIKRVQEVHARWGHVSAQGLIRMVEAEDENDFEAEDRLGITVDEIKIWQEMEGAHCVGCLQGKMKEHARVESTKEDIPVIGEIVVGDLMFVDQGDRPKLPFMCCVDVASKCIISTELKNRTIDQLEKAFEEVLGQYKVAEHTLKKVIFDRESAVVAMERWITTHGILVELKAAGQKVGLAEVTIHLIRDAARATKAGVKADFNYFPPDAWNIDLCKDTVSVLNRIIKPGFTTSPFELFTGRKMDLCRDVRGRWGEIIIVKKPKSLSSDLHETGQWAVIVRRIMNGTGVIKVYLVSTKRYAYRLKFKRARVPAWVLEAIGNIQPGASIGFEDEVEPPVLAPMEPDAPEPLEGDPEVAAALDVVDAVGEAREDVEEPQGEALERARDVIEGAHQLLHDLEEVYAEGEDQLEEHVEQEELVPDEAAPVIRRYPLRDRRPPVRLTYLLYREAFKSNPETALAALDKELDNAEKKKIWHPVLEDSLSATERGLIINGMTNFVAKFKPSGEFDKHKARVLARGDMQTYIGESEGPVCRVESVFAIICIALVLKLEYFKLDVVAAFLNTDMPEDVPHKWVLVDRDVARRLVERDRVKYGPYLRKDQRILMKMDKLAYGYQEASHYWYKLFIGVFIKAGYRVHGKDKCVLYLHDECHALVGIVSLTVDDAGMAATVKEKQRIVNIVKETFEEITLEEGNRINIIGMSVEFDREKGAATITQQHFISQLLEKYKITKRATSPATVELFDEPDSPLLADQREFMSLNSSLMYAGKRTYPEILTVVTQLARKYNKATTVDESKALKVLHYFNYNAEHCLYLRPTSLNVVSSADASYAEHDDARSHTGGCIGYEGYAGNSAYFMFISAKQSLVTKSSCEAELVCANTVAESGEWLQQFGEELLVNTKPVCMDQDNQSTMLVAQQGTGTYKRSKHIRVRYYWLKDLIDEGRLVLKYVPTAEMVADILSKPLVGSKFTYLLRKLLGWAAMD